MNGSPVFVRKKASEKFLKMNGIKSKVFRPDSPVGVSLPPDLAPLDNQVAGHSFGAPNSDVGLLKHSDGYVLKPIQKPDHGEREIRFYEELQGSDDPVCAELRKFTPRYLGSTTVNINDKGMKCLMLEDVTSGFVEPCIMDIKIGRQTWDPEASMEKIENERAKYVECRKHFAFCIPGFQVYRTTTGKVLRLGKDYGKKLDKDTVKEALKLFLNADCGGLSRLLVLQFLAKLWNVLRWCRTQHKYRIYSSSLLLAYDARRLRQALRKDRGTPDRPMSPSLGRAHSLKLNLGAGAYSGKLSAYSSPTTPVPPLESDRPAKNGLLRSLSFASSASSGSLSRPTTPTLERPASGSRLSRPASAHKLERQLSWLSQPASPAPGLERQLSSGSWHADFEAACRTHSLVNNYDRDLRSMKENYRFELDDLMGGRRPGGDEAWVTVRMIDFAHAFPTTADEVDSNYLEGIENLVKMFESLFEEVCS
ncbi:uncharacterized protein LOC134542688 [Bacillus rossius redtenbacheri]|uniref:uncharacterized protein LOC134542688 n=1 Tax=Bacillus rossius redtenbacheri TaxID=93214 RepID=UPI002FDCB691